MTPVPGAVRKDLQYYKFCLYGFLKDLRFFEPFMLLFLLERGFSFLELGTLYAFREIAINILEIPTGIMADALGRRRTMILSFLSYIASFLCFFLAPGYWMLVLAMGLFAFGEAFRTGTHKAMIFTYLHQNGWDAHKAWYYGRTRGWSQAGRAVSSLLAALLVLWQGTYAPVFLFSIVPYVLDLVLILSYPASLDGIRAGPREATGALFRRVTGDFFAAFHRPLVLRVVGNQALFSGYYKAMKDFLQALLKVLALGLPFFADLGDEQRSAILVGLVYGFIFALSVLSARQAGAFAGAFRHTATAMNLSLYAGLGCGLASGLALLAGTQVTAVIFFAGIILVENLRKLLGVATLSDYIPEGALASALSAESQAETLFAALFAAGLGALVDLVGLGWGILGISGLALLLGLLLRAPVPRTGY